MGGNPMKNGDFLPFFIYSNKLEAPKIV